MVEQRRAEVTGLGAQGDGFVETAAGRMFITEGLPGEQWHCTQDGTWVRETDSDVRQPPPCRHFSVCGGCSAQHMAPAFYADWKLNTLRAAFAHRGLEVVPEPLLCFGEGRRRRTTFSFTSGAAGLDFGYHRAASSVVVDIAMCPVLRPEITDALEDLRAIAELAAPATQDRKPISGQMTVTVIDHGLDVALDAPGHVSTPDTRVELSRLAQGAGIATLAINGDVIVEDRSSIVTINGAQIRVSPESFLQAVAEAEAAIAAILLAAIGKRTKSIADLFCGVGTFSFPLARHARVDAYDGDESAIALLEQSIHANQGYKPITPRRRDLFRDPLSARELRTFDAVVLNPPRAGAAQQVVRLAKSDVKIVAMVSCNAGTLARDAAILIDGGYKMQSLTPVDQFIYTPHLEVVAIFQRPRASASRRST